MMFVFDCLFVGGRETVSVWVCVFPAKQNKKLSHKQQPKYPCNKLQNGILLWFGLR